MPRKTEQVDVHLFHVNGDDPRRLGGIDNEKQAVFLRDRADTAQIHDVSGEVGGVGADDGAGLRRDQRFELLVLRPAQLVTLHKA